MNVKQIGYSHTTVNGEGRMGILPSVMTSTNHDANVNITLGKLSPLQGSVVT